MDANAKYELASIKSELNSIIRELESVSYGVRHDFVGVGSEKCADCIDRVLQKYYTARNKLNNVDTSNISPSFAQTNG